MLNKDITYVDFGGTERTETFYFHLTKGEVAEFDLDKFVDCVRSHDIGELSRLFKTIILSAVGVKSLDGRRFQKSEEISDEFYQTNAYAELFDELTADPDKMEKFIQGCLETPKKINTAPAVKMEEAYSAFGQGATR